MHLLHPATGSQTLASQGKAAEPLPKAPRQATAISAVALNDADISSHAILATCVPLDCESPSL